MKITQICDCISAPQIMLCISISVEANGTTLPIEIREYLNAPGAGVEPVPWYIVKVKRWKNTGN